jgi:hypothetical protein
MWCATGYVTFQEIQRALRMLLRSYAGIRKISEKAGKSEGWRQGFLIDSQSEPMSHEQAEKAVLHECIDEFFLNCPSLSVFSPSGVCLRIDARIAAHREVLNLGWQYSFIQRQTGIICGRHLKSIIAAASPHLAQMRKKIDEIDQDEYSYVRYCELCKVEDDYEMWAVLKTFDGWAIGCERDDAYLNADDFICLELLGVDDDAPLRVPDLKARIIEAHDKGQIEDKNTLWKTVFRDESREAFRAAYSEAKLERPEIGKRGPKSLSFKG